jgi:2-keto-3-deoxy-L-rhamnonate aldolase RhmA
LASIRPNTTKRSLLQGKAVIGPFVFLSDPAVVEMAGLAGFDFVVIDMEHTAHGLAEVQHLVRAAETAAVTPIVRVPAADEKLIVRVLEAGAQGVMVPLLETVEDAARSARAVRYPPGGTRGTFFHSRPARYGAAVSSLSQFFTESNEEVLLVGLIETPKGVDAIEGILDAGVEVAVVGRGDLSSFMGLVGQGDHPAVAQAARRVLEAAGERSDARWGGIAGAFRPSDIQAWGSHGARFFLWRDDWSVLIDEWRSAVQELRPSVRALDARPDGLSSPGSAGPRALAVAVASAGAGR